jgi:hypothetical protein
MSTLTFIRSCHIWINNIINEIDTTRITSAMDAVEGQLPGAEHCEEGDSLVAELDQFQNKRGPGPRSLAEILPVVLAQ